MRLFALTVVAVFVAGCGADDEPSGSATKDEAQVETTDAGTKIIAATDEKAGLRVEVQDDTVLVTLTDDAPDSSRQLEGTGIGGSCEDDGGGGVEASGEFPVYWREDPGDWGSALAREDVERGVTTIEEGDYDDYQEAEDAKPRLAEHVTRCRLFAPTVSGEEPSFDSEADAPIATVVFRE